MSAIIYLLQWQHCQLLSLCSVPTSPVVAIASLLVWILLWFDFIVALHCCVLWCTLWFTLYSLPGGTSPKRGLGLTRLVHEEDHPESIIHDNLFLKAFKLAASTVCLSGRLVNHPIREKIPGYVLCAPSFPKFQTVTPISFLFSSFKHSFNSDTR